MEGDECQEFVTKNLYKGGWDKDRKCMEGFGVYKMQDGTVYSGGFRNGLMHGLGIWQLGLPYNCRIVATSKNGKLESVQDIFYADGIHLKNPNMGDLNLNFDEWNYCSTADRRYAEELFYGMKGFSTEANSERLNETLKPGEYDTGDGIFVASTGFKYKPYSDFSMPEPNFVSCSKERKWLVENYRKGLKPGENQLPVKMIQQQILNSNVKVYNEPKDQHSIEKVEASLHSLKAINKKDSKSC